MKQMIIVVGVLLGAMWLGVLLFSSSDDPYVRYGLKDLTAEEKVETLERQTLDGDIIASNVTGEYVRVDTKEGSNTYALDQFYLSIAPYIDNTHPCDMHNFVTCQSELSGETLQVHIEDDEGNVHYDDALTLESNGFGGIWLPKDIDATITVTYGEKEVTSDFTTNEGAPTCMTEELKLQ